MSLSTREEIARDVPRSYANHPRFNDSSTSASGLRTAPNSTSLLASLERTLQAIVVYNKERGYWQGMNFLAGYLLLLFSEERAFWMLVALLDDMLPELFGYVSPRLVPPFLIPLYHLGSNPLVLRL